MKYLVLKELPQGQEPGEVIELEQPVADVLILVGAVRLLDAEKPPRGRYRRADLQAEARDLVPES